MTEWQPIETAPRDGTEVLCFRWHYGRPDIASASWKEHARAFGGIGWHYPPDNGAPTHWMPLPQPPQG